MEIAVLAWGSLIWQPANEHGELRVRPDDHWRDDGPLLPVEFARISSDLRLTLVVVPGYEIESRVLWRWSGHHDLEAAIDNLAARETGAPRDAIHAVMADRSTAGAVSPEIAAKVGDWLAGTEADAAIWTGLQPGSRWDALGGFSLSAAVAHVASLSGGARERAEEYVLRAPPQIDTPVRRALEAVLGG